MFHVKVKVMIHDAEQTEPILFLVKQFEICLNCQKASLSLLNINVLHLFVVLYNHHYVLANKNCYYPTIHLTLICILKIIYVK